MKRKFPSLVKIALILVYLVIVAGALVRMTGSGMGCPDWPKCFGYYIPPTNEKQLEWSEGREFKKGQVIIREEQLLVAKDDFTTGPAFDAAHWEPYTRHDYAVFNVYHTWTEYINRLCGALAGLACFVMAVFSLAYWKKMKRVTLLSWLVVFLMGFQGWLGATVVYSVLNPVKISLHMVTALLIVALVLYILNLVRNREVVLKRDRMFRGLLWLALAVSLVQIVLGTQVRQFVDEQIKVLGYDDMSAVLSDPVFTFYIHRTFTFVVIGLAVYMWYRNRRLQLGYKKMNWVVILLAIEAISGVVMYYFHFPFGMQTTHLVVASILFGVQFYMVLESGKAIPAAG